MEEDIWFGDFWSHDSIHVGCNHVEPHMTYVLTGDGHCAEWNYPGTFSESESFDSWLFSPLPDCPPDVFPPRIVHCKAVSPVFVDVGWW